MCKILPETGHGVALLLLQEALGSCVSPLKCLGWPHGDSVVRDVSPGFLWVSFDPGASL